MKNEHKELECQVCPHGKLQRTDNYVLTCDPPKYKYKCDDCGFVYYLDFDTSLLEEER